MKQGIIILYIKYFFATVATFFNFMSDTVDQTDADLRLVFTGDGVGVGVVRALPN